MEKIAIKVFMYRIEQFDDFYSYEVIFRIFIDIIITKDRVQILFKA